MMRAPWRLVGATALLAITALGIAASVAGEVAFHLDRMLRAPSCDH